MSWERKGKAANDEWDEREYPDVMVDIETMGTRTDTVVLSIGAVRFRMGVRDDIRSIINPKRSFYARLDDGEQASRGRTTSPDTLDWWAGQSDAARSVLYDVGEPVSGALERFTRFCRGAKRIWGNGNMFDNAIVRDLYDQYDQTYPVEYWRDLDVRTLTWLWNFCTDWKSKGRRPVFKLGEEHNALDDARRQVLQVQKMVIDIYPRGSRYES